MKTQTEKRPLGFAGYISKGFIGGIFAHAISTKLSTSDRRQSKTLLTSDERGSKLTRNSVFDFHLSLVGRQMAIKNFVSNDFQ